MKLADARNRQRQAGVVIEGDDELDEMDKDDLASKGPFELLICGSVGILSGGKSLRISVVYGDNYLDCSQFFFVPFGGYPTLYHASLWESCLN